jgi:hypothetical protein
MRKMIIIVSSQGIWVLDIVLKMVKNNLVTKLLFFRLIYIEDNLLIVGGGLDGYTSKTV